MDINPTRFELISSPVKFGPRLEALYCEPTRLLDGTRDSPQVLAWVRLSREGDVGR